jgi:hypothetical protein
MYEAVAAFTSCDGSDGSFEGTAQEARWSDKNMAMPAPTSGSIPEIHVRLTIRRTSGRGAFSGGGVITITRCCGACGAAKRCPQ